MPHVLSARLGSREDNGVRLECNDGVECRAWVVSEHIIRVLFIRPSGVRQPRTWAILPPLPSPSQPAASALSTVPERPSEDSALERILAPSPFRDTPIEGYERLCIPFPATPFSVDETHVDVTVSTAAVRLKITLQPFGLSWFASSDADRPIAKDRPSRPYHFSLATHEFEHHMARQEGDVYLGLGDKTGPMNLHGRRLRIAMKDALGYNPESGDPLYKHWPFLIARDAESKVCYGILYDNMGEAAFDLGCEHSNYYGLYRSYEAKDGDLDMYFILGPGLKDVVSRKAKLTGPMALGPRWALGFHCTAMPLADAPDAQKRMESFIEEAKSSGVPCSAFHFGSGYTSIGKRRYVFHWNRDKFPDPKQVISLFNAAGMRVVANVKPCLLTDHPSYSKLEEKGCFVARDAEGSGPAVSQFWDGEGAHVDFTHPKGIQWWREGVQDALLNMGIDSAWNDNNEYEITEEAASCSNFGNGRLPLSLTRPLHSLLMTRASFEQQIQSAPAVRPYSISRAGFFGVQRYAQTWTGDNSTSWASLRWNLRMGLTLSMSGMFNLGHDVGGFSGPAPDPELLVRWVQAGMLHPRFIMNSWKADGTVTTPWMHPSVLPLVRWAIRFRYRLIPYLYSLFVFAARLHEPILRPTFFNFPDDDLCWMDSDELLVGKFLLAAPIFNPSERQRMVYLPKGVQGWFDFYSEEYYVPGREIMTEAPLSRMPLFAPAGAIIPMTSALPDFSQLHDEPTRVLRVFPPPYSSCNSSFTFVEDDGLSVSAATSSIIVSLNSDKAVITLVVDVKGPESLPYSILGVSIPSADTRQLRLELVNGPPGLQLIAQKFSWHEI